MEFKNNLTDLKAARLENERDDRQAFCEYPCKKAINELLFQYMPPATTIADVEDLACAIFKTIQEAW